MELGYYRAPPNHTLFYNPRLLVDQSADLMSSMDKVIIRELTLLASIGVYDWEHQIQQKLVIDLEMGWDNRPAAASDDIALALDYASVSQAVGELVQGQHHKLVETLAEKIAAMLLNDFSTPWVKVSLKKPGAVPNAATVGVEIERSAAELLQAGR